MRRGLPEILLLVGVAFALGVGSALLVGRGDYRRWDREQRQPLLAQIATVRAANRDLLERPVRRDTITLPPRRVRDTLTITTPAEGAPVAAWREVVTHLRQDNATVRAQRDAAETQWATYGQLAITQGAMIDTLRAALAVSDSTLGAADTVLRHAPRARPRWLSVSGEALAIVGGGRVLALEVAALPGRVQVIGRAISETGRPGQVLVGVRVRL